MGAEPPSADAESNALSPLPALAGRGHSSEDLSPQSILHFLIFSISEGKEPLEKAAGLKKCCEDEEYEDIA